MKRDIGLENLYVEKFIKYISSLDKLEVYGEKIMKINDILIYQNQIIGKYERKDKTPPTEKEMREYPDIIIRSKIIGTIRNISTTDYLGSTKPTTASITINPHLDDEYTQKGLYFVNPHKYNKEYNSLKLKINNVDRIIPVEYKEGEINKFMYNEPIFEQKLNKLGYLDFIRSVKELIRKRGKRENNKIIIENYLK